VRLTGEDSDAVEAGDLDHEPSTPPDTAVRLTAREPDEPGSAREAVHKAFRTTVSRGGVAPFCYAMKPPGPCGELCNLLTAALDARSHTDELREAAELLRRVMMVHHAGHNELRESLFDDIRTWVTRYDERTRKATEGTPR